MEERQNASRVPTSTTVTTPPPINISSNASHTLSERERVRQEFYATYDVMTGVRIAVTLGCFFGLMVILVVYKSKSKTEKALENPKIAAAAVAEAEEEERQIAEALEATSYCEHNPRGARRSLGNMSTPSGWVRTKRFSSVGGYSSLLSPPTRPHCLRMQHQLPSFDDEDSPPSEPPDDREEEVSVYGDSSSMYCQRYLDLPGSSRRMSSFTCSSSDTSYLERRDSSVMLGLPAPPPHRSKGLSRRRQSSPVPENYDFYYPIDIRVIHPTPKSSPCSSERALYDAVPSTSRLAPLASISSCNSSLAADYPDLDMRSLGSDSVFLDDAECVDTDDDVEPFSTDSEDSGPSHVWCRRKSVPVPRKSHRPQLHRLSSLGTPCERRLADHRPQFPLPEVADYSQASSSISPAFTLPTFPLTDRPGPSSARDIEDGAWSQETLF